MENYLNIELLPFYQCVLKEALCLTVFNPKFNRSRAINIYKLLIFAITMCIA